MDSVALEVAWRPRKAKRPAEPAPRVRRKGLEPVALADLATIPREPASTQPTGDDVSPREQVGAWPNVPVGNICLADLAAKARIVEALSSGDVRVLAAELRADLEALAGPIAGVVAIAARRGKR